MTRNIWGPETKKVQFLNLKRQNALIWIDFFAVFYHKQDKNLLSC
jgi:hypothetical protein